MAEQLAQVIKKEDLIAILQPLLQTQPAPKSTFVYWLAAILIFCSFAFFGAVVFYPIHCESNIIFYLMGATTTVLSTVVTYFFGSSSGSSDKNDIFKTLADTAMANAKRRLEIEEDTEEEEKK